MASENWEEINEWEIEEDIDLAKRITVHTIHSVDDENEYEEYQLIQAHKHPTYAAAAKWGELKKQSSNGEKSSSSDGEKSSSSDGEKPSSSKNKESSSNNNKVSSTNNNKESSSNNKESSNNNSSNIDEKSSFVNEKLSSNSEKASKTNNTTNSNNLSEKKKPPPKDDKSADLETISKGDHDVDYDVPSSKNRKENRRNNTKLHKIQSKKLMSSLISDAELEANQDLVKGDTNRDPDFKQYKLLKKSLALNKKYSGKSKNEKKDLKIRVEVL